MQILLALIYGAAVGAVAHYTAPGRDVRGVALLPMLGAVVGAATWMLLTWLGQTLTSPWLWSAAVVVPPVVVYGVGLVLTRLRHTHDERERARAGIA